MVVRDWLELLYDKNYSVINRYFDNQLQQVQFYIFAFSTFQVWNLVKNHHSLNTFCGIFSHYQRCVACGWLRYDAHENASHNQSFCVSHSLPSNYNARWLQLQNLMIWMRFKLIWWGFWLDKRRHYHARTLICPEIGPRGVTHSLVVRVVVVVVDGNCGNSTIHHEWSDSLAWSWTDDLRMMMIWC